MESVWQVEENKFCNELLEHKFPKVKRYGDIRESIGDLETVEIISGGDPCPSRSRAKGDRKTVHPDLSGYFLAVVGRLRPQWVVRENVCAPDVVDFCVGLDLLGYGVVAFELDARDFTSQSRRRQFVVASSEQRAARFRRVLLNAADGFGFSRSLPEETTPIAANLTAHPNRVAAEDSYCFEPATDALTSNHSAAGGWNHGNYLYQGGRLRFLTTEECEGLQGFPRGWTAGFSRSRRRQMIGNAVAVPVAKWIGRRIMEVV